MSTLEEVRTYQSQGISEEQIIQNLRQKGTRYKDIVDALSQTKIRDAVESPEEAPTPSDGGYNSTQPDMEPSIMGSMSNQQDPAVPLPQAPVPGAAYLGQPYMAPPEGYPGQTQPQEYAQYPEQYAQQYQGQGYPQQMAAPSSDMITEIAEQIVAQKFTEIRKSLEKLTDIKSTLDARVEYIDERLKRMEKIIDSLQVSVLRKVGDYVTNVQDIKSEMIETQKTFAKLVPQIKDSMQHKTHSTEHHTQHKHNTQTQHKHPHEHHSHPNHSATHHKK